MKRMFTYLKMKLANSLREYLDLGKDIFQRDIFTRSGAIIWLIYRIEHKTMIFCSSK